MGAETFTKIQLNTGTADDADDPTHVDYKSNVVMKAGKYTDEELRKKGGPYMGGMGAVSSVSSRWK